MRMPVKAVIMTSIGAAVAVWLGAQALAPSAAAKRATEFMPAGAVLYLEARDFHKLLTDFNRSPEKKAWLEGQNYQAFLRSHLVTRLSEARKAYLEAAGLPDSTPMLDAVAGTDSAIALYDIGKLQFLYTTKLKAGQFAGSSLAAARSKFETRKAGSVNYFIRSKGDSSVAFAIAGDRLFLATREDLIATALKLFAGSTSDQSLEKDAWFAATLAKSPAPGDLRLITNLAIVTKTPQFRSYWIQRNITELRQFTSSVANVRIANGSITEERILLRAETKDPVNDASVAGLLRYVPADAGFYEAIAKPSAGEVAILLQNRLFGSGDEADLAASKIAPPAPDSPISAGEDDFETRVDRVLEQAEASPDPFSTLANLAANTDAILQFGSSKLESDQVLVALPATVVLHGVTPWKLAAVKRELEQITTKLWASKRWIDSGPNAADLAGVEPLTIRIDEDVLVLSTFTQTTASPLPNLPQPASYIAVFRHSQEFAGYERLTSLIDHPSIPQGNDPREPLFFSENVASLARALGRLDTITVTERDTGADVRQSVVYKLRP